MIRPIAKANETASPSATIAPASIVLSEFSACQGAGEKEWVEIHNTGTSPIALDTYKFRDITTSNKQSLSGEIAPGAYLQIELQNPIFNDTGGDTVKLVDQNDTVLDSVPYTTCDTSWVWARFLAEWKQTTQKTPGKANVLTAPATPSPTTSPTVSAQATPTPTVTPTRTPTPAPTASPFPAQPTGIELSEIVACQAEGEKEWVEIANTSNSPATLEGWKLTDDDRNEQTIGTLTIASRGLAVVEIVKYSRGMLTNDGDVVSLVDATGRTVDTKEYSECSIGASIAKVNGVWTTSAAPTKGSANTVQTLVSATGLSPSPSSSPIGNISTPASQAAGLLAQSLSQDAAPVQSGEVLGATELDPSPKTTRARQENMESSILGIVMIGVGILLISITSGLTVGRARLQRLVRTIQQQLQRGRTT